MSSAAKQADSKVKLDLDRLERAVEEAAVSLGRWKKKAGETSFEVARLRTSLEELASKENEAADGAEEVRRLRAENAALRSRMMQARKQISGLMQRLASLDPDL